jgi:DNA-binding GntR family transcriptional regulator
MSDGDIRQIENILVEAVVALQRDDVKTYATRDREFHEAIAEQSGNAALIEALRQFGLQIRLCGTISNVNGEFAERTAHGYDDIIQAFKARDPPRAAFLVRAHISRAQEAILARFPNEIASR